jgi:hypothetical protein
MGKTLYAKASELTYWDKISLKDELEANRLFSKKSSKASEDINVCIGKA